MSYIPLRLCGYCQQLLHLFCCKQLCHQQKDHRKYAKQSHTPARRRGLTAPRDIWRWLSSVTGYTPHHTCSHMKEGKQTNLRHIEHLSQQRSPEDNGNAEEIKDPGFPDDKYQPEEQNATENSQQDQGLCQVNPIRHCGFSTANLNQQAQLMLHIPDIIHRRTCSCDGEHPRQYGMPVSPEI